MKKKSQKPKPTRTGICRECNAFQEVPILEWHQAAAPRCDQCGAILDRRTPSRRLKRLCDGALSKNRPHADAPSEPAHEWSGWLYSDGRWERVCTSTDVADCGKQLGAAALERGNARADKSSCITGGNCPNFIPHDATQAIPGDAKGISAKDDQ